MRARRGITARYLNVADSVKKEVASPSFPFFPPSVISGLPEIIWIWQQIASELLAKIKDGPSVFTEKLVVELIGCNGLWQIAPRRWSWMRPKHICFEEHDMKSVPIV